MQELILVAVPYSDQRIYPVRCFEYKFGNIADLGLFNGMKAKVNGINGDGRNIDTCEQRMVRSFAS